MNERQVAVVGAGPAGVSVGLASRTAASGRWSSTRPTGSARLGGWQIADAAVIGRPDDSRGEVPVAVAVPRGELDTDRLRAWVAAQVAPYKRIADVVLTDLLPALRRAS